MTLILRAVAASDPGLVRSNNEDSAFVGTRLLVIADGVGGAPAGEVASEIAVRALAAIDGLPDGSAVDGLPDRSAVDEDGRSGENAPVEENAGTAPVDENAGTAGTTGTTPADGNAWTAPADGNAGTAGAAGSAGSAGGSSGALSLLTEAAAAANREIAISAEVDPAIRGMGTTLTAVLLTGDEVALLHVGDSRAYLLHEAALRQLTRDDTYVQGLVDRGVLTREDARRHPRRSLVTQAVQGQVMSPSTGVIPVVAGDRLLLCSDGLSDVVTDEAISETLRSYPDRNECAESLVKLALQAGGPDNITVVVADVQAG
jgi:protein phosphatase